MNYLAFHRVGSMVAVMRLGVTNADSQRDILLGSKHGSYRIRPDAATSTFSQRRI
jgi:hypothetical protein